MSRKYESFIIHVTLEKRKKKKNRFQVHQSSLSIIIARFHLLIILANQELNFRYSAEVPKLEKLQLVYRILLHVLHCYGI